MFENFHLALDYTVFKMMKRAYENYNFKFISRPIMTMVFLKCMYTVNYYNPTVNEALFHLISLTNHSSISEHFLNSEGLGK